MAAATPAPPAEAPILGSGRRDSGELDMTPMVDITFLLLIFFMVTAAFALQKAMEVPPMQDEQYTQAQTIDDPEDDLITVRIDGDNVFWIGAPLWDEEQQAPSDQEMRVKVRQASDGGAGRGPSRFLVQANGDAVHEKVVAALDAGMSVQIEKIQLMTYEDEDF